MKLKTENGRHLRAWPEDDEKKIPRKNGRPPVSKFGKKVDHKALIARSQARALSKMTKEQIHAMSPLEVILYAMHLEVEEGRLVSAVSFATEAAPYIHPKLVAESITVRNGDRHRSDADIIAEIRALEQREALTITEGDVASKVPVEPDGVVH